MKLRLRSREIVLKYAAILLTIWFTYGVLFGFWKNNNRSSVDHEFIEKVVEKIKEHQNMENEKSNKRIEKDDGVNVKLDDHDHPIQERKKAQDQIKDLAGKIQINAPENLLHDLNAPGNFLS